MAYDGTAAERVRKALKGQRGFSERKMFGGIAFLLNGNMCCGIMGRDLVLRLGNEEAVKALRETHTREMDFTGKPMRSMVFVGPAGYSTDRDLSGWVKRAIDYVKSLPPK